MRKKWGKVKIRKRGKCESTKKTKGVEKEKEEKEEARIRLVGDGIV